MSLLTAALDYSERRVPVFPIKWDGSKQPLTPHGFKDATTDEITIRAWWNRWPNAWIGMPTGNGMFVLDADPRHSGDVSMAQLESEHGPLPKTRRASTLHGGEHVYLLGDVGCTTDWPLPGIDIRGDGGYVVLPPSPGYGWISEARVVRAQARLLELLNSRNGNGSAPPVEGQIPHGERNATLASMAGTMRRRGFDAGAILAALLVTNEKRCLPPLPEADVRKIAASVGRYPPNPREPENSGDNRRKGSGEGFSPLISAFPQALGENAYCGLAGEIVRQIDPHTEADPAAVMISLLTMFGNAVGRGPYFDAGDYQHATNLFAVIVGETDSGRKGTATESPRRIMCEADPAWKACVKSGLASGEGIIHHVRDKRTERRKPKKGEAAGPDGMFEELVDSGVEDKRLMVFESEFAKVLAVGGRKDSTLSAVLRDAWDRGDLQTLSKNSPERATGALVSVLTQITPVELEARLDSTDVANGFMNRFVLVAAKRSKFLPRGGNVPAALRMVLADRVAAALKQARLLNEVDMTPDAWLLWDKTYGSLVTRPRGLVGVLTARAAPMVRRFAQIYALLDERSVIEVEHLEAALELRRYVEESTRWVFGGRFGDRVVDDCLLYLTEAGDDGLTRNDLRELLGHHIAASRITNALKVLESAGRARWVKQPTDGRPVERWFWIPRTDGSTEDGP